MTNAMKMNRIDDIELDNVAGGTGINSEHNTYIEKSTGQSLSQIEVEKRLENYAI